MQSSLWHTRFWFLDQSTWGISLVKPQDIPPSWATWSRPWVTITGTQCMGLFLTYITHTSYSAFIQQSTTSICWPSPFVIHFLCASNNDDAACLHLLLIPNYTADNAQQNVKRYTQRSLRHILMLCNKVLHQQWLWHGCLMKGMV